MAVFQIVQVVSAQFLVVRPVLASQRFESGLHVLYFTFVVEVGARSSRFWNWERVGDSSRSFPQFSYKIRNK